MTSVIPLIALSGFAFTWILQNVNKLTASAYAIAGGKAEQAISAIKTVKALNG